MDHLYGPSPSFSWSMLQFIVAIHWCMILVEAMPKSPKETLNLFAEGDPIALKVNKLTSINDVYSQDYYRFPFCQPKEGTKVDKEGFGNYLAGDRIENSPYRIYMKRDMYCEQLCVSNLGKEEQLDDPNRNNKIVRAIHKGYNHNWILDGLTAASKTEDDATVTTRYWQGFPVGFLAKDSNKAYIHNHVNIEIMYHQDKTQPNKYQIVRFTVEPFSIHYNFEEIEVDGSKDFFMFNPIESCVAQNATERRHTSYEMVTDAKQEPQLASGQVLFTYDVIWLENPDLGWADRWSVYVNMDNAIPDFVHVAPLVPAYAVVIALAVALIFSIKLRIHRAHSYQRLLQNEESATGSTTLDNTRSDSGFAAIRGDVFRPPATAPKFLAVCCGTGAQLLATVLVVLVYCHTTYLTPMHLRAAIDSLFLTAYAIMGVVGGYVTAVFTKVFCVGDVNHNKGRVTLATALLLPGIGFLHFIVVNCIAWFHSSTLRVGLGTILVIFFLWFAVSTPLVFLGAYIGFQQSDIPFPTRTRPTPRPIPRQPLYLRLPATVLMNGLFPFGSIYVEVYFIAAAAWVGFSYYTFGYLMIACLISLVMSTLGTMLLVFIQFGKENHKWWWRSFVMGGSVALYFFGWSNAFLRNSTDLQKGGGWFLYQGYMILSSLCLFLIYGFAGLLGSLILSMYLFRSMGATEDDDDHDVGYAMIDDPISTSSR